MNIQEYLSPYYYASSSIVCKKVITSQISKRHKTNQKFLLDKEETEGKKRINEP